MYIPIHRCNTTTYLYTNVVSIECSRYRRVCTRGWYRMPLHRPLYIIFQKHDTDAFTLGVMWSTNHISTCRYSWLCHTWLWHILSTCVHAYAHVHKHVYTPSMCTDPYASTHTGANTSYQALIWCMSVYMSMYINDTNVYTNVYTHIYTQVYTHVDRKFLVTLPFMSVDRCVDVCACEYRCHISIPDGARILGLLHHWPQPPINTQTCAQILWTCL